MMRSHGLVQTSSRAALWSLPVSDRSGFFSIPGGSLFWRFEHWSKSCLPSAGEGGKPRGRGLRHQQESGQTQRSWEHAGDPWFQSPAVSALQTSPQVRGEGAPSGSESLLSLQDALLTARGTLAPPGLGFRARLPPAVKQPCWAGSTCCTLYCAQKREHVRGSRHGVGLGPYCSSVFVVWDALLEVSLLQTSVWFCHLCS